MLIIQFEQLDDDDDDDNAPGELKTEIEALAKQCLEGAQLGTCDGGDIGNGKINVFCSVNDAQHASDAIVAALEAAGLYDQVIAYVDDDRAEEEEPKVLWPKNFDGTFSVL